MDTYKPNIQIAINLTSAAMPDEFAQEVKPEATTPNQPGQKNHLLPYPFTK